MIQAAHITQNMYASLESIVRSSARLPGRKLAFFITDGFLMDAGPRRRHRDKLDRVMMRDPGQRGEFCRSTLVA
jgi:hypothetical protein